MHFINIRGWNNNESTFDSFWRFYTNKKNRKSTASLDNEDYNLENQLKADDYFDGDENHN